MELKFASQILNEAADILEREGWCQVMWRRPTGECCVEGALGAAATGDYKLLAGADPDIPLSLALAISRLYHVLKLRPSSNALYCWNDTPGRTKEEVIATLRKAAQPLY